MRSQVYVLRSGLVSSEGNVEMTYSIFERIRARVRLTRLLGWICENFELRNLII